MQHATCNKSYYNCNKTCNTATKWAEYHLVFFLLKFFKENRKGHNTKIACLNLRAQKPRCLQDRDLPIKAT